MKLNIIGIISILIHAGLASAQDLITDRPDFTESAVVIPSRMIQIESGAEYAGFDGTKEVSFPNMLTRIGLGNSLELRFGFSGWTNVSIDNSSRLYFNDLLLEAKYQLTDGTDKIPMAILLVSTLPVGDEDVSSGAVEFGAKWAAAYDLSDRLGLGINLGVISGEVGDKREITSLASISLGIALSHRLGAFIESFSEIPENSAWQPVVDGGLTYRVTPKAQLDFYLGKGLNEQATDLLVGVGLSVMIGY